VSSHMQETIAKQIQSLHSKRALLLALLCRHSKKSSNFLSTDLIRKLDGTLFHEAHAGSKETTSGESNTVRFIRFALVQASLCIGVAVASMAAKGGLFLVR
jgi:hypothetical protein